MRRNHLAVLLGGESADEAWLQQTDKAWDAIHRCLTYGRLGFDAHSPAHRCILGGRQMCSRDDQIVSYVTREEVAEIAAAIAPVDEDTLRSRYFRISEADYGVLVTEEDFGYTWEWFDQLKDFYARAAAAGRPVVFSVDQ